MPCPHPSTLCLLLFSSLLYFPCSFPISLSLPLCCPPDFPSPYLSHLIVASRPIPSSRAHPPPLPPVSPYLPASISQSSAAPPHPISLPQPPHSPTGGDRALPSDYTGGAGLEYSPEGRQLSISDNCRERDTHTQTHSHTRAPLPLPHSLIRGPSPSNGPEEVLNGDAW